MQSERQKPACPDQEFLAFLENPENEGVMTWLFIHKHFPELTPKSAEEMLDRVNVKNKKVNPRILIDPRPESAGVGFVYRSPSRMRTKEKKWIAPLSKKLDKKLGKEIQASSNQEWVRVGPFEMGLNKVDQAPYPTVYAVFVRRKGKETSSVFLPEKQYRLLELFLNSGGYIDRILAGKLQGPAKLSNLVTEINGCFPKFQGHELIEKIFPVGYGAYGNPFGRINFLRQLLPNHIHLTRLLNETQTARARRIPSPESGLIQAIFIRTRDFQSFFKYQQFAINDWLPYLMLLYPLDKYDRQNVVIAEISPREYRTLSHEVFEISSQLSMSQLTPTEKDYLRGLFLRLTLRLKDLGYNVNHKEMLHSRRFITFPIPDGLEDGKL